MKKPCVLSPIMRYKVCFCFIFVHKIIGYEDELGINKNGDVGR